MNIRRKLFLFVPMLVILMSFVSFFLFESSKKVQESYSLMMDRILLYKNISQETQESLPFLNRYLFQNEEGSRPELLSHMEALKRYKQELRLQEANGENNLPIRSYQNMIDTFLEQVEEGIEAADKQNPSTNASSYMDAQQTAGYIREDGQALVDLELQQYRPVYQEIMQTTERMNKLGVYLVFTVTALSIFLAFWLSSSITVPIRRLVTAAKHISKGMWDTRAADRNTNDEIGILTRTFNQMLENIQDLLAQNMENLEKDRLVKELELKALQSQINPHFLFNTLNAIAKLAYIEGAEKTSDLTVSVSKLLRYNLQRMDQAVTLQDEVEHVMEYWTIQKARFRDRITFVKEIDETVMDQLVPCLTLQPIIENALVHGIEEIEKGAVLKLRIAKEDQGVCVEISDNGNGMNEETLALLQKSKEEEVVWKGKNKSTGLGTRNVFQRLKLFYGGAQSIDIKSQAGTGTTVIFHLPWMTKG